MAIFLINIWLEDFFRFESFDDDKDHESEPDEEAARKRESMLQRKEENTERNQ